MGDTKYYSDLCNNQDLQQMWEPKPKHIVWNTMMEREGRVTVYMQWRPYSARSESILVVDGDDFSVEFQGPPFKQFIWLPTEEELKLMLTDGFDQTDFEKFVEEEPYDLVRHHQGARAAQMFGSKIELLIAYVMKRCFAKVWRTSSWWPINGSSE